MLTVISEHWKLPHGDNFRQHQHHGRYKGGVSYGKRGKQEKGESSKKGNKESKGGLIDGGGDCQQGREGEEEGEELKQENKSKEEEKGIQERRKRGRRKEGGRKTKLADKEGAAFHRSGPPNTNRSPSLQSQNLG